ncbi:MAG TPA: DNA alkylation repair protein [Anaerolineae bacterium]|mgnify:CR=1 FL=1|nr:DNA alkylation repair protein [Anaerolineae bacterium]HOQ98107.1 DNA alkylation repair protein [Anaerolineae bacterium]HPL27865.1 DNA alkylation repair protein [Anaerolineae bacterium]
MDLQAVLQELETLGTERIKKLYMSHGAHEPLFGVAVGAMKPLARRIAKNQPLAEELYATGNYDAMYFAGVIADPKAMSAADFERWMEAAYFYMLSDYVVAVTLAETDIAQQVADRWIPSGQELYMSAGWSCYEWLLGSRPDAEFDRAKLSAMLDQVGRTIHSQPERAKYAMNNFVISVGISYLPLHDEAVRVAAHVGQVDVTMGKTACKTPLATESIQKAVDKGRLGFKRRNVRC